MATCRVRPEPKLILLHPSVLLVQLLVLLDLSLTITGILNAGGVEGNPLFAPFTHMGALAMIIGTLIYYSILWSFFLFTTRWVRAIGIGFLTAIHVYGFLSWVRLLFIQEVNFFFGTFYLIVGPALLAALMTMFAYVDFRSCPGVFSRDLPVRGTPGTIEWLDE